MTSERGVIVTHRDHDHYFDWEEIRPYLLFWDEIAIPTHKWLQRSAVYFTSLQKAGALSSLPLGTSSEDSPPHNKLSLAMQAFHTMEVREPGKWSLAHDPSQKRPKFRVEGRSLLVALHRVIPVPDREVPVEDVLEFRQFRRAEMLGLRSHIEETYQRILLAGDGPLMLQAELERIADAAEDAIRALEVAKLPFRLAGLEAKLKWAFDPRLPLAGAAAGSLIGPQGVIVGAGIGALSNLLPRIEISTGASYAPERASPAVPFEYVVHMHQEL